MAEIIVEVCKIDQVTAHPNADALELCQIKGWQCVVPLGKYQAGSLVTYIPIDSLIPLEHADRWGISKYLSIRTGPDAPAPPMGRVRCARLRGEPSFGVLIDVEDPAWTEGQDVKAHYGIAKYIPPLRATAGDAAPPHPLFVEYTDIENLRNFPDALTEGEEVCISEKIHGCLSYNTPVTMADGSTKRIMHIAPGDAVLGMDASGKVTPALVKHVYNNGRAEKWLRVTGKRRGVGRGSHYFAVQCTPNHRFWNPQTCQYVAADQLQPGSPVLMLRSEMGITPVQEQILLGKLLGDAYLHQTERTAAVQWRHKIEHAEYIDWTMQGLGEVGNTKRRFATSGYGSAMICAATQCSFTLKHAFGDFIGEDGKKRVPEWVADKLGPIALAFWYMDDGSLSRHEDQEDRALFATCAFDQQDHEVLLSAFKRLGIIAKSYVSEQTHGRIRLNADQAERMFLLIAPYIPPIMQYKLPERYRGHSGWLPTLTAVYKPLLVPLIVDAVEEGATHASAKWDIETETHNFFANGLLVHNSSARVGLVEGEWMAGSMNVRRQMPDAPEQWAHSTYWFPLSLPGVQSLLQAMGAQHRQAILYGEVYGSKIQDLHYGCKGLLGFRAFDLLADGKYLDVDAFLSVCREHGVETVPILYRGAYMLGTVKALSEGDTTLAGGHIREGVVVKPIVERVAPRVGRVAMKYIGDAYLLSKSADRDTSDV